MYADRVISVMGNRRAVLDVGVPLFGASAFAGLRNNWFGVASGRQTKHEFGVLNSSPDSLARGTSHQVLPASHPLTVPGSYLESAHHERPELNATSTVSWSDGRRQSLYSWRVYG